MWPYDSRQKIIVEARNEDGSLNFDGEQVPLSLMDTDLDKLCQWAFGLPENENKDSLSWEDVNASLTKRGWKIRAKTW